MTKFSAAHALHGWRYGRKFTVTHSKKPHMLLNTTLIQWTALIRVERYLTLIFYSILLCFCYACIYAIGAPSVRLNLTSI